MPSFTKEELALKDEAIFQFVMQYKKEHDGNSPSMREIVEGCGFDNVSVVYNGVKRLVQRGKFKDPVYRRSRGIEVVGGRWVYEG